MANLEWFENAGCLLTKDSGGDYLQEIQYEECDRLLSHPSFGPDALVTVFMVGDELNEENSWGFDYKEWTLSLSEVIAAIEAHKENQRELDEWAKLQFAERLDDFLTSIGAENVGLVPEEIRSALQSQYAQFCRRRYFQKISTISPHERFDPIVLKNLQHELMQHAIG